MRAENKPIGKLITYQERFKAIRSADSNQYDYFVLLRVVIPFGITVTYGEVKENLESKYELVFELLRRAQNSFEQKSVHNNFKALANYHAKQLDDQVTL